MQIAEVLVDDWRQTSWFSFERLRAFELDEFNISSGDWYNKKDKSNLLGAHLGSKLSFTMSVMRLARLGTKVKPTGKQN